MIKSVVIIASFTIVYCLSSDQPKIVGGREATIEDFPYTVSIRVNNHHLCGGSIINHKWIVSAAHCFGRGEKVRDITIGIGATRLRKMLQYKVESIITRDYNSITKENDIALLKVLGFIFFNRKINRIELPDDNQLSPGKMAVITGWGALQENGPTPIMLMVVRVPIIGNNICNKLYNKIRNITDNMLCAGYLDGGKDSCQGDSGGPLMYRGKLVGIISWGRGCARPYLPGVYTNVLQYINWINSVITMNNVETDFVLS